jgi:hypothetical protein
MQLQLISKVSSFCLLLFLAGTAQAAIINLGASIDGAQANAGAGTGSAGTGTAAMTLDTNSKLFSWNVDWSGLTGQVTVAHFHGPAAPDANAGVQVAISTDSNPSIGDAVISDLQIDDLLSGLWYINIHSTTSPGGEIRGQVNVVPLPAAAWLFGTALLGLGAIKRRKS